MFFCQHARGQACFRILRQNRHGGLGQDGPLIHAGGYGAGAVAPAVRVGWFATFDALLVAVPDRP